MNIYSYSFLLLELGGVKLADDLALNMERRRARERKANGEDGKRMVPKRQNIFGLISRTLTFNEWETILISALCLVSNYW